MKWKRWEWDGEADGSVGNRNAAMDRSSHPFLLATECKRKNSRAASIGIAAAELGLMLGIEIADRVQHPTDPSRQIKGVDVLPWVLSPLMGPEEVNIEVR